MSQKMFSEVGRAYDKIKNIQPMTKSQRSASYCSGQTKAPRKKGFNKFSPFNTTTRETRNSYLLRVTKEPNTQANYNMNYSTIQPQHKRVTIDKASFERIIGPVNNRDYSKELEENADHRCLSSFTPYQQKIPLNIKETHKWRKRSEHLDFSKQLDTKREIADEDVKKMMIQTRDSNMMQTFQQTTQSHFNNFKRFQFKIRKEKSHSFNSDSGHQLMKTIQKRELEPEYDVRLCLEEFTKKSMATPKGQVRFHKFKDIIKTKLDRSDPNWILKLDHNPQNMTTLTNHRTLDFKKTINREGNEVHSKYPLRQCLEPPSPLNKH